MTKDDQLGLHTAAIRRVHDATKAHQAFLTAHQNTYRGALPHTSYYSYQPPLVRAPAVSFWRGFLRSADLSERYGREFRRSLAPSVAAALGRDLYRIGCDFQNVLVMPGPRDTQVDGAGEDQPDDAGSSATRFPAPR